MLKCIPFTWYDSLAFGRIVLAKKMTFDPPTGLQAAAPQAASLKPKSLARLHLRLSSDNLAFVRDCGEILFGYCTLWEPAAGPERGVLTAVEGCILKTVYSRLELGCRAVDRVDM